MDVNLYATPENLMSRIYLIKNTTKCKLKNLVLTNKNLCAMQSNLMSRIYLNKSRTKSNFAGKFDAWDEV